MPKLSIIIPVYNVEKYLKRCLDSVINQTFKNLEIIIINDASTDGSQIIIDEYMNKDNRIISIINEKNLDLGFTRNVGIKKATGEYITFLDSDDWLEIEAYTEMIELILEKKADIVECNFRATDQSINSLYIKSLIPFFKKQNTSSSQYVTHLTKNELGITVWNKIYNAQIIKNNNISFHDNKKTFGEDILFNVQIIHYANNIITIKKKLYNYFVRPESMTRNNNFINLEKISNIIDYYIIDNIKFDDFEKDFSFFSIMIVSYIKIYLVNKILNSNNEIRKISKELKNIRENKLIFKSIKSCLKNKEASFKYRFFCMLIQCKIYYFTSIIFLLLNKKKA